MAWHDPSLTPPLRWTGLQTGSSSKGSTSWRFMSLGVLRAKRRLWGHRLVFCPDTEAAEVKSQTPRVRCLAVVTRRWSVMNSNLPFRQENWRTPTTVLLVFFCFFIYGVYIYKRTSDHTSFRGSTHLPRKFGDHISLPASLCQPTLAIILRFPSLYSNERLWSHFLFERTHKRTLVIILLFQRLCTNEH